MKKYRFDNEAPETAVALPDGNVRVFYEKNKYRIGVKVGNLTDEKYWSYIGSPQKPRHFICNIVYKF